MHTTDLKRGTYPALPYNFVVSIDTETTGLDTAGDDEGPHRICALAIRWLSRDAEGQWSVMQPPLYWTFNPQRAVPDGAARVNGFWWGGRDEAAPADRNDLRDRPVFAGIADYVRDAIPDDVPIVCHHAKFDRAFLDHEFIMSGREPLSNPSICTKAAFADLQGLGRPEEYVPGTSLDRLSSYLGLPEQDRAGAGGHGVHGASADALLAANCFMRLDAMGWIEVVEAAHLPHRRGEAQPAPAP